MRAWMLIGLTGLLLHIEVAGQTAKVNRLNQLLQAELSRFPAKAGIYVKHLTTGEEASVRGNERFNTASVMKIPVMVLAYRMAEQKQINLNDRVEIKRSDLRGGSGIFRYHDVGLNPTLRDVITQMIITSDNTATDLMIAKVGGVDKVNQLLKEEGYTNTRLVQTVFQLFRKRYELLDPKYKSLTPEDVFGLQSNLPAFTEPRQALIQQVNQESNQRRLNEEMNKLQMENEDHWFGVAAPAELGRMLEGIERGTIASKESCEEMKRIMRAQQSGARRIPHFLNVPVGHKTGDLSNVANDVGIIYARTGPIVVSFFTMGIQGPVAETEDRIGRVSQLIVEYFDGGN